MSTAAIQVEGLTKFYGSARGIENVSFAVQPGEIVGLLGPNGSGKTTIMRMLTGYFTPTSGTAQIMGKDCVEHSMDTKKFIGYLPENPLLYHEMRVEQYLCYICELRDVQEAERKGRIGAVLEQLNIGDKKRTIIGRLSKGYKQRVGMAGALVHDPQILILDEPTVGLDPKQILDIRELMKSLGGKKTVVLSSHILTEVQQVCQRIVIINKGKLVTINTQEELINRGKGAHRLFVRMKGPEKLLLEKIKALQGVRAVLEIQVQDGRVSLTVDCDGTAGVQESLGELAMKQGWPVHELRPIDASLEEVFLQLTGEPAEGEARPSGRPAGELYE